MNATVPSALMSLDYAEQEKKLHSHKCPPLSKEEERGMPLLQPSLIKKNFARQYVTQGRHDMPSRKLKKMQTKNVDRLKGRNRDECLLF
jgi:hypothetical protein